jgi:hypothetical protein
MEPALRLIAQGFQYGDLARLQDLTVQRDERWRAAARDLRAPIFGCLPKAVLGLSIVLLPSTS